VLACIFDRLQ